MTFFFVKQQLNEDLLFFFENMGSNPNFFRLTSSFKTFLLKEYSLIFQCCVIQKLSIFNPQWRNCVQWQIEKGTNHLNKYMKSYKTNLIKNMDK